VISIISFEYINEYGIATRTQTFEYINKYGSPSRTRLCTQMSEYWMATRTRLCTQISEKLAQYRWDIRYSDLRGHCIRLCVATAARSKKRAHSANESLEAGDPSTVYSKKELAPLCNSSLALPSGRRQILG
jgi:hypothetical protein